MMTSKRNNLIIATFLAVALIFSSCSSKKKKNAQNNNIASPQKIESGLLFSQGSFGRYVGVLEHSKIDKDQFAKIDFIMTREIDSNIELKAVLSLYFGDFSSKEYVSYHFDNIKYNVLTGELIFDQPDQDISLKSISFKNKVFEADLRSTISGNIGKIRMTLDGSASPSRSMVMGLTGEYAGTCDENETTLHLRTYRTTEDNRSAGNPFGTYSINGNFADRSTYDCGGDYCVSDKIKKGSYDFYQGKLNLFGKRLQYTCSVDINSIDCGKCKFDKVSLDTNSESLVSKPITSVNSLIPDANTLRPVKAIDEKINLIEGEYRGFLHHERLNKYQTTSLNLITYQDVTGGEQSLQMSAVAKIFFGNESSNESISYRFNSRSYNIMNRNMVFERMSDDVDAILQLVHLKDGVIRGIWHSIQFGRVGTFELRKDGETVAPEDQFKPVAGIYTHDGVDLYLDTRSESSSISSLNPFFPVVFGGYYSHTSNLASNIAITGGSYDFYTNRIGLETEVADHVLIGEFDSDNATLKLNKSAVDIMRAQQPFALDDYILRN